MTVWVLSYAFIFYDYTKLEEEVYFSKEKCEIQYKLSDEKASSILDKMHNGRMHYRVYECEPKAVIK